MEIDMSDEPRARKLASEMNHTIERSSLPIGNGNMGCCRLVNDRGAIVLGHNFNASWDRVHEYLSTLKKTEGRVPNFGGQVYLHGHRPVIKDRAAVVSIEYAVIAAIIVVAVGSGMTVLCSAMSAAFATIGCSLGGGC